MCFGELLTQSRKKKLNTTLSFPRFSSPLLLFLFLFLEELVRSPSCVRVSDSTALFKSTSYSWQLGIRKRGRKALFVRAEAPQAQKGQFLFSFLLLLLLFYFVFSMFILAYSASAFQGKKALQLLQQLPEKTTKGEKSRPLWDEKSTRRRKRLSLPLQANRTKIEISK